VKIGIWFNVRQAAFCLLSFMSFIAVVFLQGCAHSAVSREAENQVDKGYLNTVGGSSVADSRISDIYQNTSQTTKGVLLGGAGGAIAGGLITGVGVLPGAASGAILGGAFGNYLDSYITLADQLENRHIKVFALGDQIKLMIPSDQVFNGQTPYIMPTAYSSLDLIAKLINSYQNIFVRVAVYSDATVPAPVACALTREQANSVVKYLWRRGINTRFIYGVGEGGTNLVTKSSYESTDSLNYRIEISLEKLPA
jgi:outer membrane protein OmpA-like peptidoglycan-associated protein